MSTTDKLRLHILVDENLGGETLADSIDILAAVAEKIWNHFIDLDIAYRYQLPDLYEAWKKDSGMGKVSHRVKSLESLDAIKQSLSESGLYEGLEAMQIDLLNFPKEHSSVLISKPMLREEQPKALSKAQISGWKNPIEKTSKDLAFFFKESESQPALEIVLNTTEEQSLGKMIGAVAHISQKLATDSSSLIDRGYSKLTLSIRNLSEEEVSASPLVIQDAGHTEVTPGYVTAALIVRK